ncbi:hypothetical protein J0X12_15845 [Sneathiella sp. CAU 1612]|jgi:hypothetical protein|uniref:Uncharacterized protein n=1 Tax=Sneathiella sedimenti TaxID=2816034 RepID=A0ABS3F9N2_9PROT|nr:hypothetical protein [Sneathiella sedimenti]MBO0335094.1 hypothetical protein [Sneathiella sedimenti]
MSKPDDEKKYWLDEPKNIDKVFYAVLILCALVAVPDILSLLNILYHKHIEFEFENIFEFYSLYGLVCYVGLVLIAKKLRNVLMRDEDYYD